MEPFQFHLISTSDQVAGPTLSPPEAGLYSLTGPTTGNLNTPSTTFTITPPVGGWPSGTVISLLTSDYASATPFNSTDSSWDGVTLRPTGTSNAHFTYTGSTPGTFNVSCTTNKAALIDPASIVYNQTTSGNATTYNLTALATSGVVGVTSQSFTLSLPQGVNWPSGVTLTPQATGASPGTFASTDPTWDGVKLYPTGGRSVTFKYIPAAAEIDTISVTNSAGMTNAAGINYVASAPATPAWGNFVFHMGWTENAPTGHPTYSRNTNSISLARQIGVVTTDPIPISWGPTTLFSSTSANAWLNNWVTNGGYFSPWIFDWVNSGTSQTQTFGTNGTGWPSNGPKANGVGSYYGGLAFSYGYTAAQRLVGNNLIFQKEISEFSTNLLQYYGRYILDNDKESAYTYGGGNYHAAAFTPQDTHRFVYEYLMTRYSSLAAFNTAANTSYSSWDDIVALNMNLVNPFTNGFLKWLFIRWATTSIWKAYYDQVADESNSWKLLKYSVPAYLAKDSPFTSPTNLTGTDTPVCRWPSSLDFISRGDSSKKIILQTNSPALGAYANHVGQNDTNLAWLFGMHTRSGGWHNLYFYNRNSDFWFDTYGAWASHPKDIRDLYWWAYFHNQQNTFLANALTPAAKIAYLGQGGANTSSALTANELNEFLSTYTKELPLLPWGYTIHQIDWQDVLDGALSGFQALILTAPRLPANVLTAIVNWKAGGGKVIGIWCGGMFDVFGNASTQFNQLFGCNPATYEINQTNFVPANNQDFPWDTTDPLNATFSNFTNVPEWFFNGSQVQRTLTESQGTAAVATAYGAITVTKTGTTSYLGYLGNGTPNTSLPIATQTTDGGGTGIYVGIKDDYLGQGDRYSIPWESIFGLLGINPDVTVTIGGIKQPCFLRYNATSDAYFVVAWNSIANGTPAAGTATVAITGILDGYSVYDCKQLSVPLVATTAGGSFSVTMQPCSSTSTLPYLWFLSKTTSTINSFVATQQSVNSTVDTNIAFDGGTIPFFVNTTVPSTSVPQFGGPALGTAVVGNCAIVLGETTSAAATTFANNLQALFWSAPVGSSRVTLPIYTPSQVTPTIEANNHLLLIGNGTQNSLSQSLITAGTFNLDASRNISGRQVHPYQITSGSGGNAVMVLDSSAAFQQFYDFVRWRCFMPGITTANSDQPMLGVDAICPALWETYTPGYTEASNNFVVSSSVSTTPALSAGAGNAINISTLFNTTFGTTRNGLFTSAEVCWPNVSWTLTLNLPDTKSVFYQYIGEYMFQTDGLTWLLLTSTFANAITALANWNTGAGGATVIASGSLSPAWTGANHTIQIVIQQSPGNLLLYLDGVQTVSQTGLANLTGSRTSRAPGFGAAAKVAGAGGGGSLTISNLVVNTKDYDTTS